MAMDIDKLIDELRKLAKETEELVVAARDAQSCLSHSEMHATECADEVAAYRDLLQDFLKGVRDENDLREAVGMPLVWRAA